MQMPLRFFVVLLLPTVVNSLTNSNLRAHAADMSRTAMEDQMWPFNIFGGGRKTKEGTFKQKLENFGDTQYFGEIEVGGQKLKAVIDTGSFELLVFGSNCTACGDEKHLYDNSKSKNAIASNFEAMHSFGSGSTFSKQTVDKFKVGSYSVTEQSFWEVYNVDMQIASEGRFQSIFGVGPPSSALKFAERDDEKVHKEVKDMKRSGAKVSKRIKDIVDHYDDMVDLMKNITSVSENLDFANMSICLGEKTGSPGYFFWDDHATQNYPEKFETVNVHGDFYWTAPLGQVRFENASVQGENVSKKLRKLAKSTIDIGCSTSNCSAIVDTGTSLLVAPTAVVDKVYDLASQWEAAGGTCEDLSELPELRFTLNEVSLSLPPEAYMGYVSGDMHEDVATYMPRFYNKFKHHSNLTKQGNNHMKRKNRMKTGTRHIDDDTISTDRKTGTCEVLIMSMDVDSQFGQLWILGMPFFRKYYTTFQFVHKKGKPPKASTMSFSEQDGECGPGSAPQTPQSLHANIDTGSTYSAERMPRRAQLQIDTSKLFVPNIVRKAQKKSLTKKLMRPFVHI